MTVLPAEALPALGISTIALAPHSYMKLSLSHMPSKTKRVLILAGTFSPHSGPGSTRAVMFTKYLPDWEWEPGVVCGEFRPDNCQGMYDPAFCPEVQQRVIMRYNRDPMVMRSAMWQKAYEFLNRIVIGVRPELSNITLARRLRRVFLAAVREFQPDVVFATAIPVVNHTIASLVCRQMGIPWVADFRDWLEQSEYRNDDQPWRHRWRKRRWVAAVRSANAVVTVSEGLRDMLMTAMKRNVHVIRNGFDPESYTSPPPKLQRLFMITYTGNLFLPQRDPRMLFHALDTLNARGVIDFRDIRLNFVGTDPKLMQTLCENFRCRESIRCLPWMSRSDCVHLQQSSHVLLLCAHAGNQGVMTSKLYEYLGANRPILSIPRDDGEVDALLCETQVGLACSTIEEIIHYLSKLYVEWQTTGSVAAPAKARLSSFNRRSQAGALAEILSLSLNNESG